MNETKSTSTKARAIPPRFVISAARNVFGSSGGEEKKREKQRSQSLNSKQLLLLTERLSKLKRSSTESHCWSHPYHHDLVGGLSASSKLTAIWRMWLSPENRACFACHQCSASWWCQYTVCISRYRTGTCQSFCISSFLFIYVLLWDTVALLFDDSSRSGLFFFVLVQPDRGLESSFCGEEEELKVWLDIMFLALAWIPAEWSPAWSTCVREPGCSWRILSNNLSVRLVAQRETNSLWFQYVPCVCHIDKWCVRQNAMFCCVLFSYIPRMNWALTCSESTSSVYD